MVRGAATDPAAMAEDEIDGARDDEGEEEAAAKDILAGGSDVCKTLMERYAGSSAPQHRHLCASAAAMRSILSEEGLPLTPPAYFAAAITALRDVDRADPEATVALAAFFSILLPLVPARFLPPPKAEDAASVLASFLRAPPSSMATGTVRSMINSLGYLALRVDLEDWGSVEVPLDTLLMFAMDRRPKVRRCAQVCVEKVFKTLRSSSINKKASKVVLCMYRKYILMTKKLTSIEQSEVLSKHGHIEILHMLNLLILLVPNLSQKVKIKILSDVYKLLGGCFSWHTRHILGLIEVLLEHSESQILIPESDNIISVLTSYVSIGEKNPIDTVISASALLRNALNKLHDAQPSIWIKNLPPIITSIAGLLSYDVSTSKHAADILKELINIHIDQNILLTTAIQVCNSEKASTPEEIAVISICTVFDNMLDTCDIPTEYMLAVISMLFLKLGELSYFHMKKILLKLTHWAMRVDEETSNVKHVKECVGAAVIAMGPEKLLSIIPITLNAENLTISNTWLIPILKQYVVGASLQYFMEHIVPLAKSLQNTCNGVKEVHARKCLQSCACGLWSLLPAFCRYPTDTSQNFESLAKLLIVVLKEDTSLHETITIALKELVNENKNILRGNHGAKQCGDSPNNFIFKVFDTESECLRFHYSRKTASRNIKALASNSMGLFQTLADVFFGSTSEKCTYLKEAIGCLASIMGGAYIQNFFVSALEKFGSIDDLAESKKMKGEVQQLDKKEEGTINKKEKNEDKRWLLMELASSLVEAADADLINLIFDYIKTSLRNTSGTYQSEAYSTLSTILKEHSWFHLARTDELVNLLLSINSSVDGVILKNRLSCFHYLLVHILQCNEDDMNTNAFLILNEIILTLKSKKESRKLAYDILLNISYSLKSSQSAKAELDLLRLFNMVMGYLSSSSPHIMSGAVSALSCLIYNDAHFCLSVPNLVPSVLVLLQNKDNEVIKAVLGFIKVLVSSLHSNDLSKVLIDIVNGVLPWSSVSKHHFRSKVGIILEILIRKCGYVTVNIIVPEKYKGFVKKIAAARQNKKNLKEDVNPIAAGQSTDSVRGQKRVLGRLSGPVDKHTKDAGLQKAKRRKHESTGKGVSSRSSQSADSRNFESRIPTRARSADYKNRRKGVETPRGGDRRKIQRNKGTKSHDHVATAPKSAAANKSNKHKRLRKFTKS